jgi:murein DD-endopeptidase MepM/ murein hydrolase activator NlpD
VVKVARSSTGTVFRWTVGAVALLWLGSLSATAAFAPLTLQVTHHARSVQPGEVVILEVAASEPPVDISGEVFGAAVRFYPAETEATTDPDHSVWRALVGIDLDTATGEHAVVIRATSGTGSIVDANYTLTIEPKEFPTRRLTVAPNYVNPPAETIERIQREVVLQRQIFTTSSAERLWRGGFLRPVPGESSSSFGRRSVFNGEARSPHSGTDFRAGRGTSIKAPNDGIVVLAGDLYFSGNVVIIDHGWGLYSFFAHLSEVDVTTGEVVARGDVVGKVGATGRVTGAHLHWTVRLNNARVDPIALMALLPAD